MATNSFFRYCKVTIACTVLLSGLWVAEAEAQRRSLHRIVMHQEGEVCYYQIQDQADQSAFRITPLGAVLFQSRGGVKVRVEVADAEVDDGRGTRRPIPGVAGNKKAEVSGGQPVQSLAVREAQGVDTDHKVNIQCCTDRNLFGCKWSDAQPAQSSAEMGAVPGSFLDFGAAPSGPNPMRGPAPSDPYWMIAPLPPGGPVMKIEEDT
jgi:hypothetical protein